MCGRAVFILPIVYSFYFCRLTLHWISPKIHTYEIQMFECYARVRVKVGAVVRITDRVSTVQL